MDIWFFIGILTIAINGVIILLLPPTLNKYQKSIRSGIIDVGQGFLMLSILLGQPVAIYENLIYFDNEIHPFSVTYDLVFLKITFVLAALAIICYNLYLLTTTGLPDWPVAFLMVTMGFATGAMAVGLQLDPNIEPPIFYNPVFAGLIFIGGLMVFNIVGMIDFLLALNQMRQAKGTLVSWWHISAAYLFFIGPIFVFATRILKISGAPLNLLFFPFLLAFAIEMILYLRNVHGLPILGTINSVALLNTEEQVVMGGFHKRGNLDLVRLSGMAMIATGEVLQELAMKPERQPLKFGYGDVLFVERTPLILLVNVAGNGAKIARIAASLLLRNLWGCKGKEEFRSLVLGAFHQFFLFEDIRPELFFFLETKYSD